MDEDNYISPFLPYLELTINLHLENFFLIKIHSHKSQEKNKEY